MQETTKSILVIDDDHNTRASIREQLEAEGYSVFSAANGEQGMEVLRRFKPPGLILVDLIMPIMDGNAFIAAIEDDPKLSKIPVVIITAFPEKGWPPGTKAVVQKPINNDALLSTVKMHCGTRPS